MRASCAVGKTAGVAIAFPSVTGESSKCEVLELADSRRDDWEILGDALKT